MQSTNNQQESCPKIDEDELSAWQVAKEPQKWFPYDPTFVEYGRCSLWA
jgi:hypothetical protein